MRDARPYLGAAAILVSTTKGLETDTLQRMSQVIEQEVGRAHPVVVLSGPSFAVEVARRLPTAVLAASRDPHGDGARAGRIPRTLLPSVRSVDVVGVEIGGAMKNVIAIAAGVVEGLGLGQNALAALITRGLAEIARLACAAGGAARRWPA